MTIIMANWHGMEWHDIKSSKFPDGSLKVELTAQFSERIMIKAQTRNYDDLFELALVVDAVRRQAPEATIELHLPYLLGAQHDRLFSEWEPVGVSVVADFINNVVRPSKLCLYDVHNEASIALFKNVVHFTQESIISRFIFGMKNKPDFLVSPDAGSSKKIDAISKTLKLPVIECSKKRDSTTGALSACRIIEDNRIVLTDKHCMIVDDIAVYGGSFKPIVPELWDRGANKVTLFTTHAILPGGYDTVDSLYEAGIDHIYTTDSYCQLDSNNKLTVFKI